MIADLPIFPLSTVLFPGGVLPLRIFEARYMDMVRDCMQRESPFGVCLITKGGEVGEPAEHEPIGCLAHIRGWDMQQLGLLQLRTIGGARFRIVDRRVGRTGLIRASVDALPDDERIEVPDDFADCAALLGRIVDELREREPDADKRMIAEPVDLESAAWVANRLCEFLPIPNAAKHKLMALDEPLSRLQLVQRWLQQHQVL
ncbi:MAG TPA: LON peptidase substrate-binding domain-containing protein [Burkholderiaceae bacterium]|jgi:Lon protease-like protein|nr:LON peptidase substrate-binding domain-containing protein [Burkholderiaceae bacterium]